MKKTIKILLTALTVALLACLLCMALNAESSGNCGSEGSDGSNLTWHLDDEGTLTIDGSGAMKSYSYGNAPWFNVIGGKTVKKVVIKSGCTSIGSYAFYSLSTNYIESVSLPDTLRTIGSNAFWLCKSLTEINIPSSVTNIYYFAFSGCSALEKLTLSEGLKTIGSEAFSGCTKLSEITIPSTVEAIAANAFANCTGLKKITNLSKATISDDAFPTPSGSCGDNITWKFDLVDGKLEITGTGGMPNYGTSSTNLAPWKDYHDNIKTVTISEGITSLGDFTFYSFGNYSYDNLTSVSLPSTLKSIGSNAFYMCKSLESIVIPDGVTKIETNTFYGCTALKTVTLPKNLTSIGNSAFAGSGISSVVIPDSVNTIVQFAFNDCRSLEKVTLGNGLTSLGADTFKGCSALTEVVFNCTKLGSIGKNVFKNCTSLSDLGGDASSITAISPSAFENCTALKSSSLAIFTGLTTIGDSAFAGCTSLDEIIFPESLTSIGTDAFKGCTALSAVTLPKSLTAIGNYTFYNTAITSIAIPKSVSSIGEAAFASGKLESITVAAENTNFIVSGNCLIDKTNKILIATGSNPKIPFDWSVTKIGKYAFYGSTATAIAIPGSVTEINYNAFDSCALLTEITLPSELETIGQHAFKGCTSLKTVIILSKNAKINAKSDAERKLTFPSTTVVYAYASAEIADFVDNFKEIYGGVLADGISWSLIAGQFEMCGAGEMPDYSIDNPAPWYAYRNEITTVDISDDIYEIGSYSFYDCTELVSVEIKRIGDTVKINSSAFEGCKKLENFDVYGELYSIESRAFAGCTSLASFDFGYYLQDLGGEAFRGCTALTSVSLPSALNNLGSGVFTECTSLTSLYFPERSSKFYGENNMIFDNSGKRLYLACQGLKEIVIPEGVTVIEDSVFENNTVLEKITLPQSLVSIGSYAFSGCTALKNIVIPENLGEICSYAFSGSGLISVTFPKTITSYGTNIFADCAFLETVNFLEPPSESSMIISDCMFKNCTSLKEIAIPRYEYLVVGDEVFNGCTALAKVTILAKKLTYSYYNAKSIFPEGTEIHGISGSEVEKFANECGRKFVAIPGGSCGENLTWYFYEGTLHIEGTGAMTDYDSHNIPWSTCVIENVVISDGVTTIGSCAFWYKSFNEINLPASIIEIGESAFYGCDTITTISLPDAITKIGNEAFFDCRNLESVKLPKSLTYLGIGVFANCEKLTSVVISEDNTSYSIVNNCIIDKINSKLIMAYGVNGNFIIPSGVLVIGEQAFSGCKGLTALTIPMGVTEIEAKAFYKCINLASVNLPASLTKIGSAAFYDCGSLCEITLPKALTYIGEEAFVNCAIQSITIPDSVESINDHTFSGCASLSELTLNYGLKTIGVNAFANCTALKDILIPATVTEIRGGAFAGCGALWKVIVTSKSIEIASDAFGEVREGITFYVLVDSKAYTYVYDKGFKFEYIAGGKCGESLTWYILDSIMYINGEGDMYKYEYDSSGDTYCGARSPWQVHFVRETIYTVIIGKGVTSISETAFYTCHNIESFIVADGNTHISVAGNCLINNATKTLVAVCKAGVFIPDDGSVTKIGDCAFYEYSGASEIFIPSSVVTIGAHAFSISSSLEKVTLNEGLQVIGYEAFSRTKLTEIEFPSTLTVIYDKAFSYTNIRKVHITKNLTEIIKDAFRCGYNGSSSKIESITADPENERYAAIGNCLIDKTSGTLIFGCQNSVIPHDAGLVAIGEFAFVGVYIKSVEIPDGVVSIGYAAFNGCSSLINIVLPESLTTIGEYSFGAVYNLKNIAIPDGVTDICDSAFHGCSNLESITLPSTLRTIGNSAFYGCRSLKSVSLPEGLEKIGDYAFSGTRFESIVIPASVTEVGSGALGYGMLKDIVILSKNAVFREQKFAEGTNIYGYSGSTAETSSSLNNATFVSLDGIYDKKTASVTLGADFTLRFSNFNLPTEYTQAKVIMTVRRGDKVAALTPVLNSDGTYSFRFENIAPQTMGDEISYTLTIDGVTLADGTISVKSYLEKLLTRSAEELGYSEEKYTAMKDLIGYILTYGAAAQEYTGYKEDELVNGDYKDLISAFENVTETDKNVSTPASADAKFTGVGVRFNNVNNVFFRFTATDISKVKITINGIEAEIVKTGENTYTVYSEDIFATDFTTKYTAVMTYDGEEVQTVTYSVKSFVNSFQSRTDASGSMTKEAKLARALWLYGNAAVAFAGK